MTTIFNSRGKFYKPMLAKQLVDYIDKIQYPVLVQPKLDGVRALLTADGFKSRNNKLILGVPNLYKELESLNHACLDGELFSRELSFQQIVSSVKRTVNIEEDCRLQYFVFDCNLPLPFSQRYERIANIRRCDCQVNCRTGRLAVVKCIKVYNECELMIMYKEYLKDGYEGIIIRDPHSPYESKRTASLLKMKPTKEIDALIVGFERGTGKYNNSLGALVCKMGDGKEFKVGTGFDDDTRYSLWVDQSNVIYKKVNLKYQELTDGGVPRFPVYVTVRNYYK